MSLPVWNSAIVPSSDVRSSETSAQNARGKNLQKFVFKFSRLRISRFLFSRFGCWLRKSQKFPAIRYSSIWLVLTVIRGLNCKLKGNITSCGTWNSYYFLSVYGPTCYYRNKGNVLRYVTGSSVVLWSFMNGSYVNKYAQCLVSLPKALQLYQNNSAPFHVYLKFSLMPRPHSLMRKNGLVNRVEFLGVAHFCD